MKFKGVEKDSVIREIGSLYRSRDSSDWNINVNLTPGQSKKSFGVSQIPILSRRRVLNATDQVRPAGFQTDVEIENTRSWHVELIESCPIRSVSRQEDRQQWCFVFDWKNTRYYLPQLELARVLFFHHAYLVRLSLIQKGLSQEFDVQRNDGLSEALVNILPTCTLPLYVRGDYSLRRALAWILLDQSARSSYESIARNQLQQGYNTKKHRVWRFQFEPPPLSGVKLTFRGHFDMKQGVFFVYEVDGIFNLKSDCPSCVDFVDPRFSENRSGDGSATSAKPSLSSEPEIDDDQDPCADHSEIRIAAKIVTIEFVNPIQTNRISKSKTHAGSPRLEGGNTDLPDNTLTEISTDEASNQGTVPSADYDGLDDTSEDTSLYAVKFRLFDEMVDKLMTLPDCSRKHRKIRKLPSIEGYSKQLLADGNPRCLLIQLISKSDEVYALLEVDTSDNKNSLSTLVLKKASSSTDWNECIGELEARLVKRSLVWPTSFLDVVFGCQCKRVAHQKILDNTLLDQDSTLRWAERVYQELN